MMDMNVERQMKLIAITEYLKFSNPKASEILDIIDSVEIYTQSEWMEEERQREAELTTILSREAC